MDPLMFATRVRSEVEAVTNCSCSVGLGSNLLLARLALKLAKPAGQAMLRQDQAEQALEKLEVVELPGVGRNTVARSVSTAFILLSTYFSSYKGWLPWGRPQLENCAKFPFLSFNLVWGPRLANICSRWHEAGTRGRCRWST